MAPASEAPVSTGLRTHPASVLVRVWIWVAAGLVGFGRNALEEHDSSIFAGLWLLVAIVAVAALLGVTFGYLSWWFTRYSIDGREIRVDSGVLTRRSRRAPYERIQAVDIAEPIAARIFGLSELRIELAGGDDSRVPLQYLRRTDAERLRSLLLQRAYEAGAAGVREEVEAEGLVPGQPAPETQPDASPPLLVVPPQRLVVATLLSTEFLVPLGLSAAVLVLGIVVPGFYFGLVPLLWWLAQIVMNRVVAQWGFTLRRSPRGLHLTRGLLSRVSQTVPYDRVQAVVTHEALLWRWFGWQRAEVTVAGASRGSDDEGSATLLPIGRPPEVERVVTALLGELDIDESRRRRAPRRSAWFAPVGWRFRSADVGPTAIVTDRGWLSHRRDVIPPAKVQGVSVRQGPLQRACGLADVAVATPRGPVDARGTNLAADDVRALTREVLGYARAARG